MNACNFLDNMDGILAGSRDVRLASRRRPHRRPAAAALARAPASAFTLTGPDLHGRCGSLVGLLGAAQARARSGWFASRAEWGTPDRARLVVGFPLSISRS
jgi:hypothetical protein